MEFRAFLGNWEVISYKHCIFSHGPCSTENQHLEGVRFRLDPGGDVLWTITDDLKSEPLFSCETYEISISSNVLVRFGAYAGHVLEFRCDHVKPRDKMVLTCDNWCALTCKRVSDVDLPGKGTNILFSLLPALEEGYFSDATLLALNKKEFKVHTPILKLQGSDIEWDSDCPFSNLPEDVLGTILHFLYAECLPENLKESTAHQVIGAVSQYTCLSKLVNKCNLYLRNQALKHQIVSLVNEMHECLTQIVEYFNAKNNLMSSPEKLCYAVKQSIRDTAVACIKLVLLCDLFTKRKQELSREERHDIIRYAKSRLPIFLMQLQRFLEALKATFSSMSAAQRLEVAIFLVPEIEIILDRIEVILDRISELILHVEKSLQQMISSNDGCRSKDSAGKCFKNVLHLRELAKWKNLHEHVIYCIEFLFHKKDIFNDLSPAQKVRSIARNLEQLIQELPLFLMRLGDDTAAFDEKLEWREFKFCFKVGTSKVSGILETLVSHRDVLADVMTQLCDLVQRDAFNQSLSNLGLLSDSCQKNDAPKNSPKHCCHSHQLNLVKSLCVPPTASKSFLSDLAVELLESERDTDMEFEVVSVGNTTTTGGSEGGGNNDNEGGSQEESVKIKAHRVIVAARCDWFRRALQSGMRESIDKKIMIHDTSPQLFRTFLEYLYTGRLKEPSLSIEHLVELLLLSDRYQVDFLKQTCEHALQPSIDQDSALYFFNMADQYNARILKNFCLDFISQHQELTDCEIFMELPIALQAEIFDCVWTQPAQPTKSSTMEHLLPVSPTSPDYDGSQTFRQGNRSNSSSTEDLPLGRDPVRLEACLTQLRDIIGSTTPREQLEQVVLAADYDLCRAVNFYYARNQE